MSWRLFTATCAASLFLTSCGDSDKSEQRSEPVQKDVTAMSTQNDIEDATAELEEKIAKVEAEVKEKEAEALAEIEEKKAELEAEIKEKEAELKAKTEEISAKAEEKVADYKAMVDKYLKMDMTAVKSVLGTQNETTLNGLASEIMETIKAETEKITKLSESLKNLSFSDLSKASELKTQIAELTKSKDKLTELYDAVKAQIKALTGK